ncbi:ESX secretion-associated protein EspG [Nocardia bovistercoris]|uniref:ESX secretion-associated protein EspG n=1 Tax=Nocardia bovistercoris TaxID=2785916 RepID=A0A931IA69_9NOCA|nr:ESX secretion-associated protein EspG [Nocardia bovistercoris]MBH0777594.1 ESX secretion-associated protein EspG [Nocardia bovistercoris]
MTVHRGRLTSLEVAVLWELMSNDSLPFPLMHSPTHQYEDDYIRAKRSTAERLLRVLPPDAQQLWEAAVNPDIVIWAAGEAPDDAKDMSAVTRVVGLRREGYAVVLVQQPGESIEDGGDIDVYETDVPGLAKAVIGRLPKVGRGKQGEVPILSRQPDGLDYSYGSSPVLDAIDPPQVRSDRWRNAKATQLGELKVEPGSGAHWIQDRRGHLVRWRDLVDDGRYLIDPKPNPVAIPVDDNEFERFVNQRVVELVRRIRENRPAERDFRVL